MNREFIKALIVMGLQLLTVFAEEAFKKSPEKEKEECNDQARDPGHD